MRHAVVAIGTVSRILGQNVLEAVSVQGCLRLALGTEVRYAVTIPYRERVTLSCGWKIFAIITSVLELQMLK